MLVEGEDEKGRFVQEQTPVIDGVTGERAGTMYGVKIYQQLRAAKGERPPRGFDE